MAVDRDLKSLKILFIHHTAMWYRKPFFRKLSKIYDVKFLFTNVEGYNKTYDTELSQKIEGLEGVNYKVVKNYFGIAFGAIKETTRKYDVFVGGSWDTPTDLIETLFYLLIVKLRRKSFILWREDWDWNVNSLKRSFVKFMAGFIGRNADAILVPGSKHKEFFTSLGVHSSSIFIMPNVSNIELNDKDLENKDNIRKELNLENKKVILYVGRLIDLKGVDYLIKAFYKLYQELEDVVLLVVGDGPEKSKLEVLAGELGIKDNVIFTGNIDNSLLGGYYLLSNVFVLPSITTYFADACPLVVNEAMYFAKPVITSDAVGTTFMIQNGKNGYVVPERDEDSLCNAIYKIISNPDLEEKMGNESKKLIEKGFKYKNMVDGFTSAVQHVMKGKK
ncbi:glycosyltransferase family 4 protein [Methanobacterium sp.]|uniref:glycosyltransferase family 4 protein n=1 Tax=Methanobacterium sp. TaxID=2164 RepID=UPI003C794A18